MSITHTHTHTHTPQHTIVTQTKEGDREGKPTATLSLIRVLLVHDTTAHRHLETKDLFFFIARMAAHD